MSSSTEHDRVLISPNGALFDLPELVALEEGLFEQAGLDVGYIEDGGARRASNREREVLHRFKESQFEQRKAHVFNVCEWGGIDRLERSERGGRVAYLRPAVVAQAIVSFDPELHEPHDLGNVAVAVNEFTGSHYTVLHLLEGTIPREQIRIEHIGSPTARLAALRSGEIRAAALMEPFISIARKEGAHIIASYFYRGVEVIAPELSDERREAFIGAINAAVDRINADPERYRQRIADFAGEGLDASELSRDYYRYTHIVPFTEQRFAESYGWMQEWDLTKGENAFDQLLVV
jgi:NitT/TauT family transport system substrate-binding protein